jgi:hypothetical protein
MTPDALEQGAMRSRENTPQAALAGAHRRASDVLLDVASASNGETVTLNDIVAAFGERTYGLVLILLGVVNMVPGPPGMSTVIGFPLLLVALQLAAGRPRPWLPQALLKREYKRTELVRVVHSAQPVLTRIEAFCRPRLTFAFRMLPEQVLGAFVVLWAICVMIPLPFTNTPPSLATVIVAIALVEADGLLLLAGIAAGLVALSITVVVTGSVAGLGVMAARTFFGF